MKTFKASQLSNNPAPIFEAARENGAIIQQCRTNGEVIEEFLLILNAGPAIYALEESHDTCDNQQCQYCSEDY